MVAMKVFVGHYLLFQHVEGVVQVALVRDAREVDRLAVVDRLDAEVVAPLVDSSAYSTIPLRLSRPLSFRASHATGS